MLLTGRRRSSENFRTFLDVEKKWMLISPTTLGIVHDDSFIFVLLEYI